MQTEPLVSGINIGALRAPTSGDDRYCMLDSEANVMVIPRMEGMVGDETICSLVDKNTLWRVAKDMFNSAQNRTGMDWSSLWQALTGERVEDLEICYVAGCIEGLTGLIARAA